MFKDYIKTKYFSSIVALGKASKFDEYELFLDLLHKYHSTAVGIMCLRFHDVNICCILYEPIVEFDF